jgi:hypothetical protein
MRHRNVLAALVAATCAALPSAAGADSPFPTYRQAAADQYGAPPSQQPVGAQGGPGTRPGRGSTGPRKRSPGPRTRSRVAGSHATSPVRVAPDGATARDLPRGSLPFTGSDLTVPVLVALGLLTTGALCAAAARTARRRRA